MGFFDQYPNTDFHELNLDWLLNKMRELEIELDEFKVVNNITFSGQWDITKQYPAWTIVSDNNIGYVSQQPVPAGVVLNNTDYWVEVIDYTAQIAGLQTRVIALENTVGDASSGLVHDVDELQTDVAEINKTLATDKDEIILFGDSWADYIHDTANVMIPTILEREFDATVHNYSYGGTGFDVPNGYDEQITWYTADTSFDHDKIKYVILVAGLNEYHAGTSAADFITKITDWIDKIRAVIRPEVPIYWFMNYSLENRTDQANHTTYYHQRNYYETVMRGINRDINSVMTFGWVNGARFNTLNYFHPNNEGSIEYSMNMVRTIRGIAPVIQTVYDTNQGTSNSTGVTDPFKSILTTFTIIDNELYAMLSPTNANLAHCQTNDVYTWASRNNPAVIEAGNKYIAEGVFFSGATINTLTLYVGSTSSQLWPASMPGRPNMLIRCVSEA